MWAKHANHSPTAYHTCEFWLLHVCLPAPLSLSLSLSLSIYLSIYLSISLSLGLCLPTCLPIYLSVYLSVALHRTCLGDGGHLVWTQTSLYLFSYKTLIKAPINCLRVPDIQTGATAISIGGQRRSVRLQGCTRGRQSIWKEEQHKCIKILL